ncbi:MAG: phytanoyl-CoA dioxygenase family protein [Trueperaceae bacterium]|nr:phytanoyl-CoA dioxygenase family protein [Trueperaceae bacterium]
MDKHGDNGIKLVDHPPLPVPAQPASSFHLSEEQVRFFDENGYLVLKNLIGGDLLRRLQAAGDKWISQGETIRQKQLAGLELSAQEEDLTRDLNFAKRSDGEVFFRVNYLHNKGEDVSLELLGSPQVLGVAESLCGPNFVPTYESMVFKKAGDGESIPWHQDAVHSRKHRVFNFDLYLDESKKGAGALRVVPKSQLQIQDACNVALEHGWDLPEVIQVELEPGDVLLHDVMVLHGSERTLGKAMRRTIYYEFRAAEMILDEGPWDHDWIDRRMRLIPLALKQYRESRPEAEQFHWQVADEFRPEPLGDDATELKVAHIWHMSGSYCSATSERYDEAMAKLEVV